MTRVLHIEGGPFVVARRNERINDWEIFERGFPTAEEAVAFIQQCPPGEYTYADIREMKATAITPTSNSKH